jgi:hypothetical protein
VNFFINYTDSRPFVRGETCKHAIYIMKKPYMEMAKAFEMIFAINFKAKSAF